eukprot:PhM_4_TR15808/c0_g1_i1/m.31885
MQRTSLLHALGLNRRKSYLLNGAPGPLSIRFSTDRRLAPQLRFRDIVVTRRCSNMIPGGALVHYLGKHVPFAQKSLWSADTPVPQDRHLFMLTTLDVDAFKYFFGVQRADLDQEVWDVLSHSGLVPPAYSRVNYMLPRPIFDKEELYRYFLRHRPKKEDVERQAYKDYTNGMQRTEEENVARRPQEPWM